MDLGDTPPPPKRSAFEAQPGGGLCRTPAPIMCIALCHNVTPVPAEDGGIEYQAASPDEVALVKFTESVGVTLAQGRGDTFRSPHPPNCRPSPDLQASQTQFPSLG